MRSIFILLFSAMFYLSYGQETCNAYFEVFEGATPTEKIFVNQSTGDYTNAQFIFGEGNPGIETYTNGDTTVFNYYENGVYFAELYIWGGTCDIDNFSVVVTIGNNPCDYTDCVLPGDANGDQVADFYDMFNVGLGYGTSGPVRPNANNIWMAQPAPDWDQETPSGVNYKHLDCNGDGHIDEFDLTPIVFTNYTPLSNDQYLAEADIPSFYVQFEQDSFYIDPNSPTITVSADLYVGSEIVPAEQLYAMAAHLDLSPDILPYIVDVQMEYYENSFLGDALARHKHFNDQIDVGFARKNGIAANGFGKVAKLNIIIEDDVIAGRSEKYIPFPMKIFGAKASDNNGELKDLSTDPAGALSYIVDNTTTATQNSLATQVKIAPNPAKDFVDIKTNGLDIRRLMVYNILGKLVIDQNTGGDYNRLETKALSAGVYSLHIITDKGEITQKLIIENK